MYSIRSGRPLLPPPSDGVADPGVHPLPAGRAVDMGRVSKQLVAAGGELAALGGEMGPHAAPVAFRRSP
jgi:hypothetical protein